MAEFTAEEGADDVQVSASSSSITADCSIEEVIAGMEHDEYKDNAVLLLQLLVNKVAETSTVLQEKDAEMLILYTLHCLSMIIKEEGEEREETVGNDRVNYYLLILNNVTHSEKNSLLFCELVSHKNESLLPIFYKLVRRFLDYDIWNEKQNIEELVITNGGGCFNNDDEEVEVSSDDWIALDQYQHVASVLLNIAQVEAGRRIILNRSNGQYDFLKGVRHHISTRNACRRYGIVGTLRSILFDKDMHWSFVNEYNLLTPLLLLLVAPTPFTEMEKKGMDVVLCMEAENPKKAPEKSIEILKMLLESLVLLCQTRGIREQLRKAKVYPICRNLDYHQTEEEKSNVTNDVVQQIVDLLMRDEETT